MVATVAIREWSGTTGTPVETTKSAAIPVRFKNAGDSAVDLNNPLVVPPTGTDWSYEKWVRLQATGTFTQISNLQAYTDGANGLGTGVNIWYRTTGTFVAPAEETSTAGLTQLFTKTTATPIDMDLTNTGPFTATGDIGDFLVMAMQVQSTAINGVTPSETLTFSYDEI